MGIQWGKYFTVFVHAVVIYKSKFCITELPILSRGPSYLLICTQVGNIAWCEHSGWYIPSMFFPKRTLYTSNGRWQCRKLNWRYACQHYYYYYDYIILICIETIDYKRNIIPLMTPHKQRRSKQKGLSERRRNLLFLNLAFLSYWSSAVVVVKSFELNTSVRVHC